jgi:hypothetical protein
MGWMHLSKLLLERGAAVNAVDAVRAQCGRQAGLCSPLRRQRQRLTKAVRPRARAWFLCAQALDTPLHDAAAAGDAAIVTMLLGAGARCEARATVRRARGAARRAPSAPSKPLAPRAVCASISGPCPGAPADARAAPSARAPPPPARCARPRTRARAPQDEATPLHRAVKGGHLAAISALLRSGADVNARGEGGGTPLHTAADAGRTALVKALLEAGADVVAEDTVRNGQRGPRSRARARAPTTPPPLRAHVRTPHFPVPPAPAPLPPQYKRVALHRAVRNGHAATVAALLAACPESVDAPNENGWTPLIYAARWGHFEVACALLQGGADPHAKTRDGRSALSCARDGGHTRVATLLETAGASAGGGFGRACTRMCF